MFDWVSSISWVPLIWVGAGAYMAAGFFFYTVPLVRSLWVLHKELPRFFEDAPPAGSPPLSYGIVFGLSGIVLWPLWPWLIRESALVALIKIDHEYRGIVCFEQILRANFQLLEGPLREKLKIPSNRRDAEAVLNDTEHLFKTKVLPLAKDETEISAVAGALNMVRQLLETEDGVVLFITVMNTARSDGKIIRCLALIGDMVREGGMSIPEFCEDLRDPDKCEMFSAYFAGEEED
jgi:hypothetical protein